MSFYKKLLITPLIAVLLLVVVGVIGLTGFSSYRKANVQVCQIFHDISATRDIISSLQTVHGDIYRALAWSQLGYSQHRIDSLNALQIGKLDELVQTVESYRIQENNSDSRDMLDTLVAGISSYKKWVGQVIDLAEVDLTTASTALIPCERELEHIQALLDKKVAMGFDVSKRLEKESDGRFSRNIYLTISIIVIAVLSVLFINRKISGGMISLMRRTMQVAMRMAERDLSEKVRTTENDELGQVANAVDKTTDNLGSVVGEIQSGAAILNQQSHDLKKVSIEMMQIVAAMKNKSVFVAEITSRNSERVAAVSGSSAKVSASVTNVAAAIEEMNSSLNEVAQHCQKEYDVAVRANTSTQNAREVIAKLTNSAKEIGKVVEVINDIADQTNLLALNATIEAASAGEAGRGFAVVANEVKELARQTAQATLEIENQIASMRNNTVEAIQAMEDVGNNIEEVNRTSQSIVAAVEEQSATIGEISANVSGARESAEEIAESLDKMVAELQSASLNVNDVLLASESAVGSVKVVENNVVKLVGLSDSLDELVGGFRIK